MPRPVFMCVLCMHSGTRAIRPATQVVQANSFILFFESSAQIHLHRFVSSSRGNNKKIATQGVNYCVVFAVPCPVGSYRRCDEQGTKRLAVKKRRNAVFPVRYGMAAATDCLTSWALSVTKRSPVHLLTGCTSKTT